MKSRRSLLDKPGHDHAADAHRPGAGQRLRVDSRADDQDRARRTDIEPARAQLALGAGLETAARRPAEGDDAADATAGGPDRDAGPRPDRTDDPGERRFDRVGHVAGRDPPAAVPVEDVLATRPLLVAASGQADPPTAGLRHGRRRDLHLVEPGIAQALGDRGPEHDRIAGRDERPVARREREDGVDR